MKSMLDLQTGDQIQAYMRLSLSLELGRTKDGVPYRYVPKRPQKASNNALSRFAGTVVANDVDARVITVDTVAINSWRIPLSTSPAARAEISYSAFDRVFLLSPIHYEPRAEDRRSGSYYRPTTKAIGTNFKPYRTLELIHIPQ